MTALPKSCCLTPFVFPGEPRGTLEYHPGSDKRVKWYHAAPAAVKRAEAALILFYDVFGFNLPNPKILADRFADELGIHVYVPNYLPNPPAIEPFLLITDLAPRTTPLTGLAKLKRTVQFTWVILTNFLSFIPVLDWFAYPKAKAAVDELGTKHAKLGVVGYCRGGAIAIRVLSERTPGVECGMVCHPGPIDTKLWETIDKPTRWHLAEEDDYMKLEEIAALAQLREKKAKHGVELSYTVHEGTTHGFASRPNEGYALSKAAFEEVNADVGLFFGQHLVDA